MRKYNPKLKTKARALRRGLTDAEERLWLRLRRKQILGVQFTDKDPSAITSLTFMRLRRNWWWKWMVHSMQSSRKRNTMSVAVNIWRILD